MKERPILFSTPMVKAILEGRKTVTRRIIKPQPLPCNHGSFTEAEWRNLPTEWHFFDDNPDEWYCALCGNGVDGGGNGMKCRYGTEGDILWVRETWCRDLDVEGGFLYKATEPEAEDDEGRSPWKPSIHMPRVACRLNLKVLSIRVERLHDITEEDAIREGIEVLHKDGEPVFYKNYLPVDTIATTNPLASFLSLWVSINGPKSWDSNPWVWRIEFERTGSLKD